MCSGISSLHHVGGVGAEHHQLAVRHVDDAHDAEGDRQADRDQHQHRAEAQPEEQRLDARVDAARIESMRSTRRAAAGRTAASGSAKAAVGGLLDQRRQPVAHLGARGGRERLDGREPRAPGRRRRARRAPAPVSISPSDRRDPFHRRALAQQLDRRLVERPQHLRHGGQPDGRSGLASAKRATVVRSTRRSRLLVPILVELRQAARTRRPAASPDRSARRPAGSRRSDSTMKTADRVCGRNSRSSRSAVEHGARRSDGQSRSADPTIASLSAKLASRSSAERGAKRLVRRLRADRRAPDDEQRRAAAARAPPPPAARPPERPCHL